MDETIKKLQNEKKQLLSQIDIYRKSISNLVSQSKNKENFDKMKTKGTSYADLVIKIPQMQNEIKNLKKINDDLSFKNVEVNKRNELLLKEISQTKDNVKDIIEENAKMKKQLDDLKSKEEQLNEVDNLKDKLTYMNDKNEEMKKEINLHKEHINELMKEIDIYKNKKIEDLVEQYKRETKENKIEISELKEKGEEIIVKYNELIKRNEELLLELDENKNKISKLESNERELKIQNENCLKYNDHLKNELQTEQNKNIDLNTYIKNQTQSLSSFEAEIRNLHESLVLLTTEKTKNETFYLNEISYLTQEKNYLENKLLQNSTKILPTSVLSNENDKSNYNTALREILSYKKDNKKLYDLNIKLSEQINELTQQKRFYANIIMSLSQTENKPILMSTVNSFEKLCEAKRDKENLKKSLNFMDDVMEISSIQNKIIAKEHSINELTHAVNYNISKI